MSLFTRVTGGFHGLFRRARVEQELDAELHEFFEAAVEAKSRAGLSESDAVRAARLELGSIGAVRDRVGDVGWESVLESVWQDVRCGCRMLRRSPGFAAVAFGILALGIGANTAIFSNRDLGFQRHSVLLVTLNPRGAGYDRNQLSRLYRDLLRRLQAIPGVRSVTLSAVTPIERAGASRFASVEAFQEKPEERRPLALNWVAPKYFETLGTPLVDGRDFQFEDANRRRVAIVNQAMARHYFRGSGAVGKHVTFDGEDAPYEIIGVVVDAKYRDLHEAAPHTVYLNSFQEGRIASRFALRTNVAPTAVVAEVRHAVRDVLKTVPVARVTTLADQLDASIVSERLTAISSALFGALGAALAAIGLYGLLAYTVARRVNEIGVRMALGATECDVMRMVLKSAWRLVCVGTAAGVPSTIWTTRFAASLAGNLPGDTVFPIAVAATAMIGIALLAAYVPARRAARVNPIDALRHS